MTSLTLFLLILLMRVAHFLDILTSIITDSTFNGQKGAEHSAAHKHGCYKFDLPQDGAVFDTLNASNLFLKHSGESLSAS